MITGKQILNKRLFLFFPVLLLLAINSITAQSVKIKLIETSDVHGAILPYDFINNKPLDHSLAQVYTYVREEREKPGQHVILLDNGDLLQGQPAVYYYNFEKTDVPHIAAEALNFMGYSAASIGNHDIETGHNVYDRVKREYNFPWLAANAVHEKTGEQYFQPYHIIKAGDIKIAVLGLITPHIPNWLPEKIWEGIRFEDMITTAQKWVKIIKKKEKPDLIVGLFHAGVDYTYNNQRGNIPLNENASQLVAELVPGFDVVFVGHDHETWNYTVKGPGGNDVLIMGPAAGAKKVAVANIVMNYNKENSTWTKSIKGETLDMSDYLPDDYFMNRFDGEFREVQEYVSKPIGTFTETISSRESMFGDSPFVGLIHRIQLELTGADISFAAPLSMSSRINKGTVYVRDMFNLYRYENLLYTMRMTGREIKDYLEYSYSLWFNTMEDENDHLLCFDKDENGELILSERSGSPQLKYRYYNFDSGAGLNYTVDVSKPAGERVTITSMQKGSEFKLEAEYKVAVNSYRGNGGGNHFTEGAKIPKEELTSRIITSTEKDLRYYMMKWIEEKKNVEPEATRNWNVVPIDWWQKGKERDIKLLYKN